MALEIKNDIGLCSYVVMAKLSKTVAAAGTPEKLSATELFFRYATIIGKKADRTWNVGIAFLGVSGTNDVQAWEIAAAGASGSTIYLYAPTGSKMNFADLWLDVATAGDGVIIYYT